MRTVTIAERRARLGRRHHLASPATGPDEVAAAVLALHATDPASVFLSVAARTRGVGPDAVEDALYRRRSLIRMLAMRRTMFVVPTGLAPVYHAACGRAVAAAQRRRYEQLLAAAGAGDGTWLAEVEARTLAALDGRGEATGAELSADIPELRTAIELAPGKPYGGKQNITTWVLLLLAADGRIVRGRPRGSWISSQWRWSPVRVWLPGGLDDLPVEAARVQLARCWLRSFGPATAADLRWWTGWTAGQVRAALAGVDPVEVDLGGGVGLLAPDDAEPVPAADPWVALLPALDPTPMGWTGRSWYVGEHAGALFDRSGNIGPTVWCDGRIVGGWAQRPDGSVAYRLLEDVGAAARAALDAEAGRLSGWLAGVRVVPRFRTPLEKEISDSG